MINCLTLINNPLHIYGQARGNWFFEGQFPAKLLDAQGIVFATGTATAKEDWITENFVPFTVTIGFVKPTTSSGMLILEKDNPSDLPENADQLEIPVKF